MGSPFEGGWGDVSIKVGYSQSKSHTPLVKSPNRQIAKSTNRQIDKSTNQQIDKSTNRPIISQTQSYSLPKTSPKTHTHQR